MKVFKNFLVFLVLVLALTLAIGCKSEPTPEPDNGNGNGDNGGQTAHTHSWSEWRVTTDATCEAEGEETRTCECGESETRKIAKKDHALTLVKLVPATATAHGTQEHYECTMCHKLFNSKKEEITSASLDYAGIEGNYVSNPLLGVLNSYGDIQIYDGNVEVDKGDIVGYVFGIDANGKIIYASYYGDGYGGPSDGFYHDGSYALEAGKVCGIFDVNAAFLPWPATTTYNGQEVNAWTLYDVVVPEGGYLISIKRGVANEFIQALTGDTAFVDEEGNTLFEATVSDGALNDVKVTITKGIINGAITATRTFTEGLAYNGTQSGMFAKQDDGTYKATVTLGQWGNVELIWTSATGEKTVIWYDNTTFEGDVTAEDKIGADWTYRLYHEDSKKLYNWKDRDMIYELVYDPANNKLTVDCKNYQEIVGVNAYGSEETDVFAFTKNASGVFELTLDIAQWKPIVFKAIDNKELVIELWYDNTTFTGKVTGEEKDGDAWDGSLYHEGADKQFYCGDEGGHKYHITYDPSTKTMNVEIVEEQAAELTLTYGGEKQGTFEKQDDGTYVAIVELEAWKRISFAKQVGEEDAVELWYDNTTFAGLFTAEDKLGDAWDGSLYHEADDGKRWMPGQKSAYRLVYDPTTNTMTAYEYVEEVADITLTYGGEKSGTFEKQADGTYVAVVELEAWKRISFAKQVGEEDAVELWYDNTTFAGLFTAEDKLGDAWDGSLYHEADDGKRWMPGQHSTYKLVFDPTTNTMTASNYVPEVVAGDDNFVLDGTTKVAISEGVTIYDSTSANITLGEYTIAVNGSGTIIFASRTSTGYGGAGDGFYHDGNYQVVPGQVCGIYSIQEGFKSWAECSAEERAQEVQPWKLYTVVCPTDYHIITGSQASMANLIKAICGIATFDETSNALFENGYEDGSITTVITFEFND